MAVRNQARYPGALVTRQPAIDRVGVSGFQQPVPGHPVRGAVRCHLQQRRTAFADVRPPVMVAIALQFRALVVR